MTEKRWLANIVASLCIAAIALTTTGCLDDSDESSSSLLTVDALEEVDNTEATIVEEVIDGDTIRTRVGLVRIIGIDTPERAICGYWPALEAMEALIQPGVTVTLKLPEGQNDRDQYDRLLRYVTTEDGVDVGYQQIVSGHAVARYDSRDGYPEHPREEQYHAAQTAILQDGTVSPLPCAEEAAAAAAAEAAAAEVLAQSWWIQYPSCAALKRNNVGHPTGPFNRDDPAQAQLYDYFANQTGHRGDGEGDGLACE